MDLDIILAIIGLLFVVGGAASTVTWVLSSRRRKLAEQDAGAARAGQETLRSEKLNFKAEALLWQRQYTELAAQKTDDTPSAEEQRFTELRLSIAQGSFSPWTQDVPPQDTKSQIPIIALTNLKGGVGKTTLTLNIGAHLSKKLGKVLFVDTDYQGSLTNNLQIAAFQEHANSSPWLHGVGDLNDVRSMITPLGGPLEGNGLIGADYTLTEKEDYEYIRWVMGDAEHDLRFLLRRFLLSEYIQDEYDAVVIDAAPRLGVAGANAINAASHFVIPTLLTQMSVEPITNMLTFFEEIFSKTNPDLRLIGAVANETFHFDWLTNYEQTLVNAISQKIKDFDLQAKVLDNHIMDKALIAKLSGTGIAFFSPEVRAYFEKLGDEIIDAI